MPSDGQPKTTGSSTSTPPTVTPFPSLAPWPNAQRYGCLTSLRPGSGAADFPFMLPWLLREQGIQIHRPIVYGSVARLLTPSERALCKDPNRPSLLPLAPARPGHLADVSDPAPADTHTWTVFVRSAASPAADIKGRERERTTDDELLPGGADDMAYFLKRVSFRLHDSFPTPLRSVSGSSPCRLSRLLERACELTPSRSRALTLLARLPPRATTPPQDIDRPPYQVTETGWGEFPLQIRLTFVPEAQEKPVHIVHNLKLHHYLPVAPVPAPAVPGGGAAATAAEAGSMQVDGAPAVAGAPALAEGEVAQVTTGDEAKVRFASVSGCRSASSGARSLG